jgi:hydrogenase nickel incorporation protein HypB
MRIVTEKDILRANDQLAELNCRRFSDAGVFVVNLLGSPGSGKTTLLEALFRHWDRRVRMGVIEGDLAGTVDAERMERLGIPVVQINTAGACHLDASMVAVAANRLELENIDFLFIENVGNLVCPANFRLGEHLRLLILSVPEGDDKPIKYPIIFQGVAAVVVTKRDLRPFLQFDVNRVREQVRQLAPAAKVFEVAAIRDEGIEEVAAFLEEVRRMHQQAPPQGESSKGG